MINISKSKTRNRAILNAVYHACDDYPAADFCIRNRHLIVRKSRCVTSISTSISLILLLFLFFHFYNSKNTTPVLRVPFSSPVVYFFDYYFLFSRHAYCPTFSRFHYAFSLSLFFLFFFFSSFIFIPLFRTRYDPISLHPVHMHQL